ncbi:PqqD family protein [Neomicrococcus lactis]|uniref:PqqD family protein n=1 Tax=Neomicrococcus lactis TaxID=732241 RepID=UPI0023017F77|nr:PqqD family protein [Neomicrococcus lactis]
MMKTASYKIAPSCAYEYFDTNSTNARVVCAIPGSEAIVLGGSGTLIWEILTQDFQTESDLVNEIANRAEVPPEFISEDVRATLRRLSESGLVEMI